MAADAAARAARLSGIYAIVDAPAIAAAALRAGVTVIQYRAKERFSEHDALEIRAAARRHDALFILNDRWREAEHFDADGVHVGPDDVPFERLSEVRSAIGARLLGVSTGTVEEAVQAEAAGADYLGVGSVYATASKADAGAPIGLAGLRRVVECTRLPVAAIGGITLNALADVRRSGATMAAVVSAISSAPEPEEAARRLIAAWNA